MSFQPPTREVLATAWRPVIVDYIWRLVPIIQPGVVLTSWHRGPFRNRREGGKAESQHLFSLATDWAGDRAGLLRMLDLAPAQGLVAVDGGGHIHVQRFPKGALRRAGIVFPT